MAISTKKIQGDDAVHYIPPRKRRTRSKPKMQPPLTPMIDVTFQLLLFFILTFTFKATEGLIPATLPQGNTTSSAVVPKEPLRIIVQHAPGEPMTPVFEISGVNRQIRQADQLYKYLAEQQGPHAEQSVVIQPWDNVRWEHVLNAYNQVLRANYEKITFTM